MAFDTVVRNGTVFDGAGGASFVADIAIQDGLVVAIGRDLGPARDVIDATGLHVTPGFVDIHSHYDGQVTWQNQLSPSCDHGVTTTLMGNCAIGFAPCRAEDRELLAEVVAGVEDIPEAVMLEGVPWNWETFPEYLDAIEKRHCDIDFATQVPHAAIRVYVMGKRGADRELPNGADLRQMTAIVREAISAGALGVSTSHTLSHRRVDGALAPTETAGESELIALARGLREAGAGVFQIIIEFNDVGATGSTEFEMLKRIAATCRRPLSYTLLQVNSDPDGWRHLLSFTDTANAEGLTIRAQVAPRAVGMCLGLDLSFNPFTFHPSYRAIAELPLSERVERMRDPGFRARLLAESPVDVPPALVRFTTAYPTMFPLASMPNYEPSPESRISALAEARGVTPAEVAYDLLLADDGRGILYFPVTNFYEGNLDVALQIMRHEDTIVGLGDGGAHYGLICDASYPTFSLTHWVRDREGERLPLAWMVHALTRKPALAVGLCDRGLIAPGYKADLNIIDLDGLRLHRPEVRYDLPGGGRRMIQRADGYVATMVSGQITYRNGVATGALPGRLVRFARSDPAGESPRGSPE